MFYKNVHTDLKIAKFLNMWYIVACNSLLNTDVAPIVKLAINSFPDIIHSPRHLSVFLVFWSIPDISLRDVKFHNISRFF